MGITLSLLSPLMVLTVGSLNLSFPSFPQANQQTWHTAVAPGCRSAPHNGWDAGEDPLCRGEPQAQAPLHSSAACRREKLWLNQFYNFSHISLLVAHQGNNQSTD